MPEPLGTAAAEDLSEFLGRCPVHGTRFAGVPGATATAGPAEFLVKIPQHFGLGRSNTP
ncbi:hypothetical protein [Streptomyces iakyrus]|uniref:hypothetical protein n=1 Tax=Streptomyces iakyrus TaxID=68219 RepID=UPI0036F85749